MGKIDYTIPVAVSARHAHLSQSTIERLFGKGYTLTARSELSQTGQFAAREMVTLIGPRGRLERVRLMGPPRECDQIEISRSDAFVLGIDVPLRLSGDLRGTPGILVEGPQGRIALTTGVIEAQRHIHMGPADAQRLGVSHGSIVRAKLGGAGRSLVFDDIVVRVSPNFRLELHLDTDEANAAGVACGDVAELLGHVEPRTGTVD